MIGVLLQFTSYAVEILFREIAVVNTICLNLYKASKITNEIVGSCFSHFLDENYFSCLMAGIPDIKCVID